MRGSGADLRKRHHWAKALALAGIALASVTAAWAQYPGRIETKPKKADDLRAVAVLEWTGQAGKPSASRLVPITVFDGEQLQDGGLYLARPQPLGLDSGTEYELERAGVAQGWFDVFSAQRINGDWFGFGAWKPDIAPAAKKLPPARELPKVVKEEQDPSRPHFVRRNQTADQAPAGQNGSGTQNGAAQPGSSGSGQGGPGGTASKAGNASGNPPQTPSAQTQSAGAQPPAEEPDPERPTLRRRPKDQNPGNAGFNGAPETAIAGPDPDRPRLSRGKPSDLDTQPAPLQTTPVDLRQMVAVSDASRKDEQSFAYEWSDPQDAQRLQKQMEALACRALIKATDTGAGSAAQPGAIRRPATLESALTERKKRTAAAQAAKIELQDVHFASYALTYGGGATLVLTGSAVTGGTEKAERYVTVIAQPDIYGALQVLFTSVSDAAHLDDAPRMSLVDAVDAKGNHRGDLLFELRGASDRRFALYRVAEGRAEPIFTTAALPLQANAQ